MLEQTHDTIQKLLACGLKRNQFSVQTERNSKGEYGDVKITHYLPVERAMNLSYRLAERFHVTWYVIDGTVKIVIIQKSWEHKITVYNADTSEESPLKFYVVYFFEDSPDETDVMSLGYASDPYDLATHEVHSLDAGWNRVDVYRAPFNKYGAIGASEIDLSECGECIASASRDLAEVRG